MEVAYPAL